MGGMSVKRRELEECEEFIISVAFITESDLTLILEQLKKLENKNIKGKILSGDYLNFTLRFIKNISWRKDLK